MYCLDKLYTLTAWATFNCDKFYILYLGPENVVSGYEGDSSDMDEEGVMMSFSDSLVPHRVLPNFWLIMRIYSDVVDVFFHAR